MKQTNDHIKNTQTGVKYKKNNGLFDWLSFNFSFRTKRLYNAFKRFDTLQIEINVNKQTTQENTQ